MIVYDVLAAPHCETGGGVELILCGTPVPLRRLSTLPDSGDKVSDGKFDPLVDMRFLHESAVIQMNFARFAYALIRRCSVTTCLKLPLAKNGA